MMKLVDLGEFVGSAANISVIVITQKMVEKLAYEISQGNVQNTKISSSNENWLQAVRLIGEVGTTYIKIDDRNNHTGWLEINPEPYDLPI